MALALLESPALEARGWTVRAAEARVLEAGLWSNPELGLEAGEFGGTGDLAGTDSAEVTLSLAQTFPIGGDRERRRELAGHRARLAGWDYEAARLEVLTNVTRRYVRALAAQRRLEVAEQQLDLTEAVLETTRKRFEAGAAAEIELIRARVPVAESEVRVRRARRDLDTAHRRLALTWGQRDPRFDTVAGDLDRLHEPPPPAALSRLIGQNPRVARWATEISARRAEAALARAEAVPDLAGRVGFKRFNEIDESALVIGVSLPLPLFDRNQGEILAAKRAGLAAEQGRREAERRLEDQLSEAWTRLADAHDEVRALRELALPPATEAFEITRRAFEKGDVPFLSVLDAERTLVRLRSRHVDALADYHVAAADIEGLIGQPLSDLSSPDESSRPAAEE
jgi:cobalt-zinc-cadmium efflux system outer membrane protein